jgi:hypothetical protein
MNQLHKDTDIEVTSLSHNVETVHKKLDGSMNEHECGPKTERVSQEMNTRTRDRDI